MSYPTASSPNPTTTSRKQFWDFRSDTVTLPTEEMLQFMIKVEMGDDVKMEDPTIKQLERKAAALCGKEDAVFLVSSTMSNQISIRTHVTMNSASKNVIQSVICDARSHVYKYELGGVAFHSGSLLIPIQTSQPNITAEDIKKNLFLTQDYHHPISSIVSIENTLNGQVFPLEEMKKIRKLADENGLKVHMDGARLWNASIATGIPISEYSQYVHSVNLCLCKGLGAPVGALLVGDADFIYRARQYKKLFGGGWRQAGVLAGAAIYAIDNHWQRMTTDHENAKMLYDGMLKLGFAIANAPHTNMLFANADPLHQTWENIITQVNKIQEEEIASGTYQGKRLAIEGGGSEARFVTHLQTTTEAVTRLLDLLKKSLHVLQAHK